MLFRRFSFGQELFTFDLAKYQAITSEPEKIQNLNTNLEIFLNHYTKNPPQPKEKDKNHDVLDFFKVLVIDYSYILHTNIHSILASIPLFCALLSELPMDNMGDLLDIIIAQIKTNSQNKENSLAALKSLFNHSSFCNFFVSYNRLSEIFIKSTQEGKLSEICEILPLMNTQSLCNELKTHDISSSVLPVLNYIVGVKESKDIDVPDKEFIEILTFLYDISSESYGASILDFLYTEPHEDSFLMKTNKLLHKYDGKEIISLYSQMSKLLSTEKFPIHPVILDLLYDIYNDSSRENDFLIKKEILIFLSDSSTNYTEDYCQVLDIEKWYIKEMNFNIDLFSPYSKLIKGIASEKPKYVTPILPHFFESFVAPINPDAILDPIGNLFIDLISKLNFTPISFGDSLFIKKILLEPPLNEVANFFSSTKVLQEIMVYLFNEKRIGWHPTELMQRIVSCENTIQKLSFSEYVCDLIRTNFTPGILRFFIENISNKQVAELIYTTLRPWRSDIVTMFKSADCFSIVERKMNESHEWIIQFLTFVNTIVLHDNDHFFDEWVILQPKESVLFTLDKNEIQDLVLPNFPTDPIPIPSLVPLCGEFKTESYFNLFLLGSYAIPIYTKLGFKLDTIPNIKLITNRFVRLMDFENLMDTNVQVVTQLLMQPRDNFQIFEFFPKHGPGYVEPKSDIKTSTMGFCFSIRFDEEPIIPYHFLTFNDIYSIAVCGDKLLAPDETPVADMAPHIWHQILVTYNKPSQLINVYLNGKSIFSLPAGQQQQVQMQVQQQALQQQQHQQQQNQSLHHISNLSSTTIGSAPSSLPVQNSPIGSPTLSLAAMTSLSTSLLQASNSTNNLLSITQQNFYIKLNYIGNMVEPCPSFSLANNVTLLTNNNMTDEEIENFVLPPTPSIELIPKLSCGLALYNAFSTIYSDDAQILRLFERFETSIDEKDDYLRIIAQIPDICNIDVPLFFRNFIYALKDSSEHYKSGWCKDFALSIFSIKDIKQRSQIFLSVLNDFEFWSSMPVSSLIQFLDSSKTFFRLHKTEFDYNIIIQGNGMTQLFYLIFAVTSQQLSNSLIELYTVFLQHCDQQIIKTTQTLIKSANVWSYQANMDAENPLEQFIMSSDNFSEQQSNFCIALVMFEEEHNIQVFSTKALIYLATVTTLGAAIKLISIALSRQPDHVFMEENIQLIVVAVHRFPLEIELWNFFFSRLCDTTVDIKNPSNKLSVKKAIYIQPIFSMLFSLFNEINNNADDNHVKQNGDRILNQVTSVFNLVFRSQLSLLSQQQLPQFIQLLTGGHFEIPQCDLEDFAINTDKIKVTKQEQTVIKQNISSVYDLWKQKLQRNLTERGIELPLPKNYVDFVSSFCYDLIQQQCTDLLSKSPRGIFIISQFADPIIAKNFFFKYLTDIGKSSKKVIVALCDSLCYLYEKEVSIFEDQLLVNTVYKFCQENPTNSAPFAKFIVYSLNSLTTIDVGEIIGILSPRIANLSMEHSIILLNNLFKKEADLNSVFFVEFLKRLKKIVSFSSSSSQESHDFEQFIHSCTKLTELKENEDIANKLSLISDALLYDKNNFVTMEQIEIDQSNTKKFVQTFFKIASKNAIIAWYYLRNFFTLLNYYLKSQEKYICFKNKSSRIGISQTKDSEEIKSYRISPFVFPCTCPSIIVPSPFPIYSPSDEPPSTVKPKTSIFGLESDFPVDLELYSFLPVNLFRFSGLFFAQNEDLLPLFTQLYGNYTTMLKCRLIRLEAKIPCVCFHIQKNIILLTCAEITDQNTLKLLPITPQNYTTFIESVLLNGYGKYGMFCGRFVIELEEQHLLYIRQTNFCCHQFSFEFFSASAGNFILEFYQKDNQIQPRDLIHIPKQEEYTKRWIGSEISNFDYLLAVNFFALRSFTDLAAYPIFPRILVDFRTDSYETAQYRNLSKPVQIVADTDQQHKTYATRFQQQKFYHSENVSNPMIVSSLHVRIIPFCRYQWFINEGWDAGDRNFLAIPFHLSIGPKTMYEITPEMFALPEILVNFNKFQLKNGTKFDIELPKWCSSPTEFIERHRNALESNRTRSSLNDWFDLIFGSKQSSKEDFNIFHPLSYVDKDHHEDDQSKLSQQQNWTEMCGQVPRKVFQNHHEQSELIQSFNYFDLKLILNPPYSYKYRLSRELCSLFTQLDEIIYSNTELSTALHLSESENHMLFAITYSISIVRVFLRTSQQQQLQNGQFVELSVLRAQSPRKTILCDSQLFAVTACDEEVIFWSVANGMIIKRIPFRLVKALTIDYPTQTVFAAAEKCVKQFTFSGMLIREFDVNRRISSIFTFGNGFSILGRIFVIGSTDGSVFIYFFDDTKLETNLVREAKLTKGPIVRILTDSSSKVLHVFNEQSNINSLVI